MTLTVSLQTMELQNCCFCCYFGISILSFRLIVSVYGVEGNKKKFNSHIYQNYVPINSGLNFSVFGMITYCIGAKHFDCGCAVNIIAHKSSVAYYARTV